MDEAPLYFYTAFLLFPMWIINLSSSPETQEHENTFSFFLAEEVTAASSVWPQVTFSPVPGPDL